MTLIYAGYTNKYFTFGKSYKVIECTEYGYLVLDDDNIEHAITDEYSVNFLKK